MDFNGKVVLVTGASRGIGKEIAYQFAKKGAIVFINYNNSYDKALELKNEVNNEFSLDSFVVQGDISKEEDVLRIVNNIVNKYGKIDVLVNNASICIDNVFDKKDVNEFKRVLDVNLVGTYLVSRECAKYMRGGSCIINVASDNGIDCFYPESCDYDASKAGVISLTHNMARFYAPNIRVNAVCPGWINTDMNKGLDKKQIDDITSKILLQRFGNASEVANLVLFLASDGASFVNDSIIKVNGGVFNG